LHCIFYYGIFLLMPLKHIRKARKKVHTDLSSHPLLVHPINLKLVPYIIVTITLALLFSLSLANYVSQRTYQEVSSYYLTVYGSQPQQTTENLTEESNEELDVLFQDVLNEDDVLNELQDIDSDAASLQQEVDDVLGAFDVDESAQEQEYPQVYPEEDIYYFPESE